MAADTEKYALWGGIAVTFVGCLLLIVRASWLTFAPFAVGFLLVCWALYRYMGCQAGDERTRKITIVALTNSWLATFFFVAMYVLLGLLGVLDGYTAMHVLAITMITMLLLFGVWFAYFWRRGDVE